MSDDVAVKCFRRDCGVESKAQRAALLVRDGVKCPACHQTWAMHMFHGDQPIHPTECCPTCGGPALLRERCRCDSYDIKCPSGHQWHTCRVHKVAAPGIGHGHKGCTCEVTSAQS